MKLNIAQSLASLNWTKSLILFISIKIFSSCNVARNRREVCERKVPGRYVPWVAIEVIFFCIFLISIKIFSSCNVIRNRRKVCERNVPRILSCSLRLTCRHSIKGSWTRKPDILRRFVVWNFMWYRRRRKSNFGKQKSERKPSVLSGREWINNSSDREWNLLGMMNGWNEKRRISNYHGHLW